MTGFTLPLCSDLAGVAVAAGAMLLGAVAAGLVLFLWSLWGVRRSD